jgi:hypothetical protein
MGELRVSVLASSGGVRATHTGNAAERECGILGCVFVLRIGFCTPVVMSNREMDDGNPPIFAPISMLAS